MLVLTRKVNETIKIGDEIEVIVLAIEGEQIKLGISAPKDIDIHRQEVYQAIQQENNQAANLSKNLLNLLKKNYKND
ncbi:carbon storage regulator, CsrA [Gracilibacillus ureilyticus]|uniref:Translational regulator CsrA n=1 Tax=Gracilibacillus ureilyticus TaxID=531814 RepID=A0A1H9NYV2_9BACI|nr:carbon storage regulator CsrA [Gracilibacillus ureilyticus]SER40749.1 carbon storage regulator, CsrA [Gracilibacillus ureilyticus]